MDGRNVKPPDKGKSIDSSSQDNESIWNGFEIKREPSVKHESEEADDMVTVSASERAASGSVVNLIGGEQTSTTYDFTDVFELSEAKLELKKEKIDKEAETCSAECSGKSAIGSPSPEYPKNNRSNKNQKPSKPKRGPICSKNTMKKATKARNKPKVGNHSNKKRSTTSKGKEKQHKCSSCDYTTSYKSHLNRHIRNHTGEKPFPCTYCTKRFARTSDLQRHMRSHVSEFLFSCSNCFKEFAQIDEKSEHEINCKIRRYECHLCKEFSAFQKAKLQYHMRVHHTGKRPFGCDQCSKKFKKQFELKQHMKTHINPRPLKPKCSVCYRNFSPRIERDEHEAKCNRRGYECYLCKELTSNLLGNLKRHMQTHTGERPFQCEMCQKSFLRKHHLQQHVFRCGIQK